MLGCYTARIEQPRVLFLIDMRFNALWAAHKWLPIFLAMPWMLAELRRKPEAGMLSYRLYFSGRVLLAQQYWESFDKLLAYAHEASAEHFSAWTAFNRAVGQNGAVDIWRGTYLIEPGNVPAQGGLAAAKDRMRA